MISHFAARHFGARHFIVLIGAEEVAPPVPIVPEIPPAHGGGARYHTPAMRQRLSELVEQAYRQALKLDEREVVEAIEQATERRKERVERREAQRLRQEDFERLTGDVAALRALLERIERVSRRVRMQEAFDALLRYEIAIEEDDMEVLLLMA